MFGKVKDPVCKAKVKKSTSYRYTLNGRTFYFDSAACRETFKNDPQKFLGKGKKRSFMEKLSKVSDGRPKTCH